MLVCVLDKGRLDTVCGLPRIASDSKTVAPNGPEARQPERLGGKKEERCVKRVKGS